MPVSSSLCQAPAPFRCAVIPERERVRVMPVGELDLATAPELRATVEELLGSGFDDVVVDLADLTFLDSSGLHVLLALHAAAELDGYRFRLRPGPPAVQRIFELTGTLDQLAFESSKRWIGMGGREAAGYHQGKLGFLAP
jgi:anti-anti-sigma factor